jgi:SPP1 family predicted phage head-tail adaptor
MANCINIKRKNRAVCIGDMRDKITVQVRSITPPAAGGVDFTEVFTEDKTIWAMVETRSGVEIFDGTNLVGVATHYFYIRYLSNLTAESWVKFKSKYFDILDIQNFEERDDFMLLRCNERGTVNKNTNFA